MTSGQLSGAAPSRAIRQSILRVCAFQTFIVLIDLSVRFPYLRMLDLPRLSNFLFSFLFEWTAAFMLVQLITFFPNRRRAAAGAAVMLSLIQVCVYGHYFYFGVLPHPYSVNYLLDHTADAAALLLSSISWKHLLAFIALAVTEYVLLFRAADAFVLLGRKVRFGSVVLFAVLVLVFDNNVRFAPSSYSVTPATIFSVKYALQERWSSFRGVVNHGYVRRRFELPERERSTPRFNIILFVSESVRKRNLSAYGYTRPTSPFLDSLIAAGAVVRFHSHTTNAVSTQFSVPMLLSGNFTVTRPDQPFIYDYIQRWTDARTLFFSSQSLSRSTIDNIYNTSLDTFICQERSPHTEFNDLGADDAEFATPVSAVLEQQQGRFFSLIQFNNTHFPYTVKSSADIFRSTEDSAVIDKYDNTILEQDDILRRYFEGFRRSGLLEFSVILFTSDHGEAFGERGHLGHLNTLYGEEIDVPFWIYLPPGAPKKWKEHLRANAVRPTSHLDLFPTMMEMSGLPVDTGSGRIGGASLLRPLPAGRVVPAVGKDMIDTKAAIIGPMKYLMTVRDGATVYEAYRTSSDPAERNDLWTHLPAGERQRIISVLNVIDDRSLH